MAIIINNEQDKMEVLSIWEEKMQKVAALCLAKEGIEDEVEIGVTFVDNEGIREINREYRNIDSATDVLSFPMLELVPGIPPTGENEEDLDLETGLCQIGRAHV